MPWTELAAGLLLTLFVVCAVEMAEVAIRLQGAALRYSDRLATAPRMSLVDRVGGVALAVISIWFFALPWVAQTANPAWALTLFLAMLAVSVALLSRIRHATVRYPVATAGPLVAVAVATTML